MQAHNDIVYLNQGRTQGIQAGADYVVVRPNHKVVHPATKETVGTFTQRMGHVRVLCAQENTATAVVVSACEDIRPGDELLPWKELQSPMMDHVPPVDRCSEPSGLAQGWVIDGGPDQLVAVGGGNLVSTDLGPEDGIRPGSLLTLPRQRRPSPDRARARGRPLGGEHDVDRQGAPLTRRGSSRGPRGSLPTVITIVGMSKARGSDVAGLRVSRGR
jgi:hypothetical protein